LAQFDESDHAFARWESKLSLRFQMTPDSGIQRGLHQERATTVAVSSNQGGMASDSPVDFEDRKSASNQILY
jgi:hypothetical protein